VTWYHGSSSTEPIDRFETRAKEQSGPRDWNTRLGTHWTSEHEVAENFTYGKGRVYHAHLAMQNPKHYQDEWDLDHEAHAWARGKGYGGLQDNPEGPEALLDLRDHPQGEEIARGFRAHLKSQGHDGIVYGNHYEEPYGHPCAITLDPDQITVTGHHKPGEPCPAMSRTASVDAAGTSPGPAGVSGGRRGCCTPTGTCYNLNVPTHILAEHIHPEYDLGDGEEGWGDKRIEPNWDKVERYADKMRRGKWKPDKEDHPVHLHVSDDDALVEEGNHRSLAAAWAGLSTFPAHVTFIPSGLHRLPEISGGTRKTAAVRYGPRRKTAAADPSLTWHPKAAKDLKRLDGPVRKQMLATIDKIAAGDQATLAQTHPLEGTMKGWSATKASRGHRVIHRPNADGGLHIGYVGLHEYGKAIQRLTAKTPRFQYRWVNHGEYTQARQDGHFQRGINATADAPDDRYMAGDSMLLRFPHNEHWQAKDDGYDATYHRAVSRVPFEQATVVQANPLVPKDLPGPRPTKVDGKWVHVYDQQREGLTSTSRLSLEDYISVAEHSMEDSGNSGHQWTLPSARDYPGKSQDPQFRADSRPVNDFVHGVLRRAGHPMPESIRTYHSDYDLDRHGAQAMTDGLNYIQVRKHTSDLSLLHECAHILHGTSEGEGHTPHFAGLLHGLIGQHIGPEAADHFHRLVSMHPQIKTGASQPDHDVYWHITDKPHFKPDPQFSPDNNTTMGGSYRPGLFLTKRPESWVNGHGYFRPYVAEVHVPKHVDTGPSGYQGEKFVDAKDLGQVKVHRVIPLDEHVREEYHAPGWIESHLGTSHDGKPLTRGGWGDVDFAEGHKIGPGYKYSGPDVRDMAPEQHRQHYERWKRFMTSGGAGEGHPFGHNEFDDKNMTVGVQGEDKDDFDDEGQFIMRDQHGKETGRKWASKAPRVDLGETVAYQ
jgi:hypothetical protein